MDDQSASSSPATRTASSRSGSRLRRLVPTPCPTAQERLRSGWALIGYDVPIGRRTRYFAFIAPERKHIHLGFEYGAWMADPEHVLEGAHIRLKKVRYLTFEAGDELDERALRELIRDGARVGLLSRGRTPRAGAGPGVAG